MPRLPPRRRPRVPRLGGDRDRRADPPCSALRWSRAGQSSSSMPSFTMPSSTAVTSARCAALSGCAMSRTCRIRSASATSSSVARKAATSSVGRSLMKPTVSDRIARRPEGRRGRAWSGSSVAKSWSSRHHLGAGHGVEQRRFAGIGVADQRDHRGRHALARAAVQRAGAADLLQLPLEA